MLIIYLIGVILSIIFWFLWKWNGGKDDVILIDVVFILALSVMSYLSFFGALAAILNDRIDWGTIVIHKKEQ